MVNMLNGKIRVNDSFGVSKVVTSTQDKKEDKEHKNGQKTRRCGIARAPLDENDLQTQK